MNTNELADELESSLCTNTSHYFSMPAARMLRQLQAENEALRKTVDSLFGGLESSLKLNKAQVERP